MRKWLIIIASCVLLLALTACGQRGALSENTEGAEGDQQESYTLRIAHLVPEEHSSHVAALKLKETVETKSDGRIKVELYPNGSLYGSDREAVEAVQLGNVEMTIPAVAALSGFNKKFMVLDLPFLFNSRESAFKALDGELGQTLLQDLETNGLKGLVFAENGFRHMSNNQHPITQPEDLKGLKMRTLETPVHTDTFNAFGANASPFAFGELYTALQQNTFDAMECPVSLYYTNKFYEVQKYLTMTGHVYAATTLLVNLEFYDSLPDDLKVIMNEASVEFREYQRELAAEQDAQFLDELKKNGMEINELTAEQKEAFRQAALPIYDKYAPEIGEELIELAKTANEQ